MRKVVVLLLVALLVLYVAAPVLAEQEITPDKAFDKEALLRKFTYNGKEYDDLVLVIQGTEGIYAYYLSEFLEWRLESGVVYDLDDEKVRDFVIKNFLSWETTGFWMYPSVEIISLNGEPWQLTEYAEYIKETVHNDLNPGDLLYDKNGEAWKYFCNPKYNGVASILLKGKTSLSFPVLWEDKISMYNPLNGGKPVKIETDEEETKNDGQQSVPDFKDGAVLKVGNPKVTIIKNGITKVNTLSVAPLAPGGRTLVPIRGVIDEFGYDLGFNSSKNIVTVTSGGHKIELPVNSKKAYIDGKEVILDQPVIIKNGRTLIPLRFIAENTGFDVTYEDGTINLIKTK
ncbi:copper amine oxidase N-terminal domain-containing protein [Thermoanaerobacterium sp. DL9XJH110]|uniref:copper amine oxidase N-terminal domain-containing protein n=1 Tax=Thermoanaerobacterium sp. DL9XJH110 TaxID=3386643 RepID=UPI003BB4D528